MFHTKFLERLSALSGIKPSPTPLKSTIELQKFVNFELDRLGWYAIGHHNSKDFLVSLSEKGVNIDPHSKKYNITPIQRIWATIESVNNITGIEETYARSEGAIPITLVELLND